MIIGDSTGGIKDSGVAAPTGCTSGCNFVLGSPQTPPLAIAVGTGRAVSAPNTTYIVRFYNDVTRKVGNGYVYVGTLLSGGTVSEALYSSSGTQVWTTGNVSTTTSAIVTFTTTAYTMVPGIYYLAYCASSTTPVLAALVDIGLANNLSNFMGGTGTVSNTWGTTSDACTTGTVPGGINPLHISNSNADVEIAAVMITN
jgi:hypothetical protein